MASHAGFAAVVGLGNHALDKLVRLLYFAGQVQHAFSAEVPALNSGAKVSFRNVFLDTPTLVLRALLPGRVGLRLSGWGQVAVTPPGSVEELRGSFFDALLTVSVTSVLVRGRLKIRVDPPSATIESLSIRAYAGSTFSDTSQAALGSADLRSWISLGLVVSLAKTDDLFPPFDVSFIGALAVDPSTRATLVVVEDAVAFGLDVQSGGVATQGDATQIGNFLGGHDLAMAINPVAIPVAFDAIRAGVAAAAKRQGATLDAFSLVAEEGGFRISGSASQAAGGVSFSMLARPAMMLRDDPKLGRLSFVLEQVVVNVNPAWWVILLEVFLIFPAALVDLFATMIRSNIINGIQLMRPQDVAVLRQQFALAGAPEPGISITIDAFECHTDVVFVGIDMNADFGKPGFTGPTTVSAEEMTVLPGMQLVYQAQLGFDALADDPQLRIRWTVRIPGKAPMILVDETVASAGLALTLTRNSLPYLGSSEFDVECRVYRVFGTVSHPLVDGRMRLAVADRVDRSHPYVRWTHQVLTPEVRRTPDGSRTLLGDSVKTRRSKIHRTDLPGRCRMVSRYSQSWIDFSTSINTGPTLDYMDALPFPRAELATHRIQVCDYCFYGGPTKTVPLIP